MLTELIQNLVHLEGRQNGFNEHGGLDGALWQPQLVLRHYEHIVPQAGLQMAFHFGQVEERPCTALDELFGVVEHEQRKVKKAAVNALAIHRHVFFIEVPAPWAYLQGGDFVVELVDLAVGLQGQRAANGLVKIDLALNLVCPTRTVAVLEVGHVAVGA